MAAPLTTQSKESVILERNSDFLLLKDNLAETAFQKLNTYDFNGSGVMPNFSWITPTTRPIAYESIQSELMYNGTVYSSLNAEDKRAFFTWLPHFMREAMKEYANTYGL